ncbi:pseudouridylate synthase RPUSD4, mitochondrial-like [Clytia hemisphaerica]|uniref:pseudouridylate synthase RPUSD4, mitochondrial-like n=1 Tax=Clytia hemisphaerica TaxID=252671 RepID=UPI0034D5D4DB
MSVYIQWKQLQKIANNIKSTDLNVLYKANGLMAVNKPYGVTVHKGPKVKRSIVDFFPELEQHHELSPQSLALANRLDKNASGVLLLTYNKDMASQMADLYKQRQIKKKYLAVLLGRWKTNKGTLTGSFAEEFHNGKVYKQTIKEGDDSIETSYQILDKNKKTCMLCALESHSGLRHQIRVHVSQVMNCPILGDHKYHPEAPEPQRLPLRLMQMLGMGGVGGGDQSTKKKRIQPWQRGLIPMHLFAQHVTVPGILEDGTDLKIAAPVPEYFLQSMESLGLMFNRSAYEEKMMAKKKKRVGEKRETIFVSKGVYSATARGQVTSL